MLDGVGGSSVVGHPRSTRGGFSLPEVLVSLTLLTMVVLCTMSVFPTTYKAVGRNNVRQAAAFLAHQVAENARHQSYASIANGNSTQVLSGVSEYAPANVTLSYTATVNSVAGYNRNNLLDIAVVVTWLEYTKGTTNVVQRNIGLETRVFNWP